MLNDGERDGGYGFSQRHRDEERRRDKPAFSQSYLILLSVPLCATLCPLYET